MIVVTIVRELKTYLISINNKNFTIRSKSRRKAIIKCVIRYLKSIGNRKINSLKLNIKVKKYGKFVKSGY
jgi:hypothetical protein